MEAADEVPADLNAVKSAVEDMHLGKEPAKKIPSGAMPVRAVHNMGVPTTEGMGGIPKPPTGSKPFTTPTSKYDPLPWTDFYDSMEMIDD